MVLRLVRRVDPLRALGRAGLALAVAILGAGALWGVALPAVALLAGWNLGGLGFLTVVWATLWTSDPETTRAYAAADDPGRYLVFVLVLLTSAVSLFSSVQIAGHAATLAHAEARSLVLLSVATVALSWCMTHTAFALRYAHLYYRDDGEGVGGLEFPGGEAPDAVDFAYFAFTLGMCFQTADVNITQRGIRRVVFLHSTLSFAYNTAILAFVMNLAFGRFG